ncbi:MAG: xanthine dehydrogenase family protein molybdopterin-binding subunit [Thaumarchaeota archaeon]|nr:xanthine dehydrogenase family protein molybdopterin-binding subunit [Nitrososphaerota archaeon]
MATVTELVKEKTKLWLGQPLKRKEDPRLVTGLGKFVDDVKLPGLAYACILRSPYASALIKKVDATKAESAPGVICTLIGSEVAQLTDPFLQISSAPANKVKDYCLAVDKVHFVGEPVAAVVAETRSAAEDALELIEVEYEPFEHILDARQALEPSSPLVHDQVGSNLVFHGTWDYGDIEGAIKKADRVVRATLHFHRFSSTPIENNGVVVNFDRATGFLNIYCNNQMPMFCIPWLSFGLRFPSNKFRMITGDIGGGFGVKIISYPYIALICLLSMKAKRPVKWTEDRREHMFANHGNERSFDVEVPVKADGTILGFKVAAYDDCGAYTRYEPAGATIWAQVSPGVYHFPNLKVDFFQVMTNKAPVGPNRGYSRMQHLWMIERTVDIVAKELGLDPADVRLKNYIRQDEMPYVTPSGGIYDGGNYEESLRKAMKLVDYDGLREAQEKGRKSGKLIGIGIATAVDSGTNNFGQVKILTDSNPFSGNSEAARVSIDGLGQFQVGMGTVPQGQGHETFAAQIVADEFAINPDQITVLSGFDSAINPYSHQSGSYASRSAVMGTGALLGATKKLKAKVLEIGAHLMKTQPENLSFKDGNVVDEKSGQKMPIWQIANVAWVNNVLLPEGMEPGLVALSFWKPNFTLPDAKWRLNQTLTYSYQTHIAAIELDPESGKFSILRYVIVDDCGTQINPMLVEGQVHGAAAHGIGAAMFENFEYDENGQLESNTFVDYLVPSAVDMPHLVTGHLEYPSLFAPKGIRGVGEGGGTPLGAISNAVEDALSPLGLQIRDSHQNPQQIHKLIREKISKMNQGR